TSTTRFSAWKSLFGPPRSVVAGRLWTAAGAHDRACRPVGLRCSSQVGPMGLLPGTPLIALLGWRRVSRVMEPAVPVRRHQRRFRKSRVDDPAPGLAVRSDAALLHIVAVAELVLTNELALPPDGEARSPRIAAPPA